MAAYLVIQTLEILDPEAYASYVAQARPLVEAAGGEYLFVSRTVHPYSGDWAPARMATIRFPDMASLKACFATEAYKAIAPLRQRAVRGQALIVED